LKKIFEAEVKLKGVTPLLVFVIAAHNRAEAEIIARENTMMSTDVEIQSIKINLKKGER